MQDSKFKQILNFHWVDSKFRIGEKDSQVSKQVCIDLAKLR